MPRHAIDPRHGNHTENHAIWHAVAHLHIAHEARAPRGALLSIFVSDRAIPSLLPRNGFTPISPSTLALGQSIGSAPDWQLLIAGWELVARGYRGTPCIHTCSCHGNREFRPSACRWQRCTPSQEGDETGVWGRHGESAAVSQRESVGSILRFAQFTPASPQNPPRCCFQLHAHQVENLHIYTLPRHRWKCLLPVSALLHINPSFFPLFCTLSDHFLSLNTATAARA